jgi:hypothetical protein
MVPVTLAAALSTQPPAHVATCKQSAPQTTIVWGAAPGIFWTVTNNNACDAPSHQTTSDHSQSNSNAQQPQTIPFGLTTL